MMSPNLSGIIAIIMWCITPLLVIQCSNIPVFLMACASLAVGSLSIFCQSFVIDKNSITTLIPKNLKSYILTFYGLAGYTGLWYLAFKNAPAFDANTLNYLWPLMLVTFTMFLGKEPFLPIKILGVGLGFIGVLLLFSQTSNNSAEYENLLWGYMFAIAGAFVWASYSTATSSIKFHPNSMAIFLLIPAIFFGVLHIIFETTYIPTITEVIFLVLLGLTRVSFGFWDYAMKNGTISLISSLAYLIPVISTMLLIIFGYTPYNNIILLSAILVLAGCVIVNLKTILRTIFENEKS